MKKILLVFDGTHFSEGAFELARKMNDQHPVLLTGVFLPQADCARLWNYGDAMTVPVYMPVADIDEEIAKKNIARFKALCQKHGIECRVHEDYFDFALPELKKETRFADLLIIGSESFYEFVGTKESNEHLQDALHGVECPVLVVPENFKFPMANILCYDGSESSVFAIKQFAYLFPDMAEHPTVLVYANGGRENEIPDEINIEELTATHYPNLTITKLNIEPKKFLMERLADEKGTILIAGSYGRSLFSRIIKRSFVTRIIKDHKFPVFVAHK